VPRQRINPQRAKLNYSYTVEEVARLFGLHRNTVDHWRHEKGLATIDDVRPLLIQGQVLRAFLEARRTASKRPCPAGTLYCFKCRCARAPALEMADYVCHTSTTGNLRALCETCGTAMHRSTRLASLAAVLPGIAVRIMEAPPHIVERPTPSPNCDQRPDS
jgi:hypothetical protein